MTAKKWPTFREFMDDFASQGKTHREIYDYLTQFAAPEVPGEVVDCLSEAIDLMEDVRTGNYKPDSFTTQPWKKALKSLEGCREAVGEEEIEKLAASASIWNFQNSE